MLIPGKALQVRLVFSMVFFQPLCADFKFFPSKKLGQRENEETFLPGSLKPAEGRKDVSGAGGTWEATR